MAFSRGFSVLELLIVLTIAAVLLALAVPSMTAMIQRSRMTAAHNEFVSSLYLLRSEAAKRNRTMRMCRTNGEASPDCDTTAGGGWEAGWAIWVDTDSNGRIDIGETVISIQEALRGEMQLWGNGTALINRIAFRPTGAPAGFNNGTFTLCQPESDEVRQIIISAAGRIRSRQLRNEGVC